VIGKDHHTYNMCDDLYQSLVEMNSLKRALQKYLAEVKTVNTPRGYSFLQELVLFDFTKPGSVANWDCVSDSDTGGKSNCSLKSNGKGIRNIDGTT